MDIGIPRKFVKFSRKERAAYAKSVAAAEEKVAVTQPDKVMDASKKFREKVSAERRALGLE